MKNRFSYLSIGLICLIIISLGGCGTAVTDVQTPFGSRTGDQFGGFEIIGISSKSSTTGNQSNAYHEFSEKVNINVPVGTYVIIPAIRGWWMGYGSYTPDDLSNANDINQSFKWHNEDHHLGLIGTNITVDHINAVDASNNTQSAVIIFEAWLTDDNNDDKWWALVNYDLIFLGKKQEPIRPNPIP